MKTFDRFITKDSYTWNITHNTESTAVWSLEPERWGSLLVQEKYQAEKACDKRHPYRIIIIIIIITIDTPSPASYGTSWVLRWLWNSGGAWACGGWCTTYLLCSNFSAGKYGMINCIQLSSNHFKRNLTFTVTTCENHHGLQNPRFSISNTADAPNELGYRLHYTSGILDVLRSLESIGAAALPLQLLTKCDLLWLHLVHSVCQQPNT